MVAFLSKKIICGIFLFTIYTVFAQLDINSTVITKDIFFKEISKYEILAIAESNHTFGNHIQHRNELIIELCQKYGYEVVLYEGAGLFEPFNIEKDTSVNGVIKFYTKTLHKNFFNVYEFELIEYLLKNPMKTFVGFDLADYNIYEKENSFTAYKNLESLYELNLGLEDKKRIQECKRLVRLKDISDLDSNETTLIANNFAKVLKSNFEKLIINQKLFLKTFENYVSYKRFYRYEDSKDSTFLSVFGDNDKHRLNQMFRNVVFLKDSIFRNKKVILITSNLHAMKSDLFYKNMKLSIVDIGTMLKKKYGSKYGAVGSFSNGGTLGDFSIYSAFVPKKNSNVEGSTDLGNGASMTTISTNFIFDYFELIKDTKKLYEKPADFIENSLSLNKDSIQYLNFNKILDKNVKFNMDPYDYRSEGTYSTNLSWQNIFDYMIFYKIAKPNWIELPDKYIKVRKYNLDSPSLKSEDYKQYWKKYKDLK